MTKPLQFAGVTMTGLLAGNELATLIGLHPALRALPLRAEIEAEQALNRRLVKIMPLYMSGTVIAAGAAALDRRGRRGARLAVVAVGASALMLGITLVGNVPLNTRTLAYPSEGDATGWSAIRRRWERLHRASAARPDRVRRPDHRCAGRRVGSRAAGARRGQGLQPGRHRSPWRPAPRQSRRAG